MRLEISLSPTGDLRLHLPSGRHLDVPTGTNAQVGCDECGAITRPVVENVGLKMIKQMLHDATTYVKGQEKPGYVGAFPTQAVLDVWGREFARQRKERSIAEASERLGVDIGGLEISI